MKTKIFTTLMIAATSLLTVSCTSDMEYKDVDITPVSQLYLPADGQNVQLVASSTASTFFEWETALAEDGNSPLYEVIFDKADGDFSKPVYTLTSDDNGKRNFATITHKVLDKIGQLAGLGNGETGTIKWTVVSSRGINQKLATESRTFNLTRLVGFSELPSEVFITGEGTEGGTDLSNALQMSSTESGVYEIFTRLEANKNYYFVDAKTGSPRQFYISDTSIKEATDGNAKSTVDATAIYRITMDFNIASVSMQKVVSVGWFFSPDNKVDIPLEYQGNGIWVGQGQTPFHQESWGRDERYKFEMVLDKDGTQTTVHWGPTNPSLDSRPSDSQTEDYFYMQEWPVSQWDNKWKLHGKFDSGTNGGLTTKFTFILNASGHYRHTVEFGD